MKTTLEQSPFELLGVTTRDERLKIVEIAEEKTLVLDPEVCTKARSDLTNPRNRLSVEISWLPGLSPKRASSLIALLYSDINSVRDDQSISPLAHANLIAAAFELLDPKMSAKSWSKWIVDFANIADSVDSLIVQKEINEDRSISKFPEVRDLELIESELSERLRYFTNTIKNALDNLPSNKLVEVVTMCVEDATENGESHAPKLVHDLIDRYETEVNKYLIPEAENIKNLISAIRDKAHLGDSEIESLVNSLELILKKWDSVAQPIQLSSKAQGIDHELSKDLAWDIRSLAVDLFNDHNHVEVTQRLTNLLSEVFAELPDVVDKLDDDKEALDNILLSREESKEQDEQWAREIYYRGEIGLIAKDVLEMSVKGVFWKGKHIPLEEIDYVRWGSIRKSVNGIPTGTDHHIVLGSSDETISIHTMRKEIYESFTNKLWKAACVRILTDALRHLKAGNKLRFGDVEVDDNGITLKKHKFMSSEKIYKSWNQVNYYSYNGNLVITDKEDKKHMLRFLICILITPIYWKQ